MVVRRKNPVNLITLIIFVILNAAGLFRAELTAFLGVSDYAFYIILNVVCFVVPVIFLVIFNRREIRPGAYLKLKGFRLRHLPVSVSAAIAATLFCLLLNAAFTAVFRLPPEDGLKTSIGTLGFEGFVSVAFAVVLLPSILEEFYFRGAYQSQFSERPRIDVIVASAICFTMLHGSWRNLITPFVCSIVYAFLVYMTGSIWSAVVAHVVNNAIAVTAALYADVLTTSELKWVIYVAFLLVFFIFLYLTLRFFEKYYNKSKKKRRPTLKQSRRDRKNAASPFSPAFFVLAVLFIAKTVFEITGFWK